jgi:hypothetical protein
MTRIKGRTVLLLALTCVALASWGGVRVAQAAPVPTPMQMQMTPMPMQMQMPMSMPTGASHAGQPMDMSENEPANPLNGTQWSILNHRGAGFFVLLWGLTAALVGLQWPRRTWFRFVPPLTLFALAEFLIIRNDPKTWPIGPIGFWVSFRDPAVFEHRIFVLIIIAMGVVELLRAADRLSPALQKFALPGLAVTASILLFFHHHGGLEMEQMMAHANDPSVAASPAFTSMLKSMTVIKHEHLWFSIVGLCLAAAKLLADAGVIKGRLGATLWPLFAVALGAYMLGYTE